MYLRNIYWESILRMRDVFWKMYFYFFMKFEILKAKKSVYIYNFFASRYKWINYTNYINYASLLLLLCFINYDFIIVTFSAEFTRNNFLIKQLHYYGWLLYKKKSILILLIVKIVVPWYQPVAMHNNSFARHAQVELLSLDILNQTLRFTK